MRATAARQGRVWAQVLFLCTACRSQIAEASARGSGDVEAFWRGPAPEIPGRCGR